MKLLVFGGCGFIGTNVCNLALDNTDEVVAFDNLMRAGVEDNLKHLKQDARFKFVWGDVRNREDFMEIPDGIDGIINFAANPAIPKSFGNPIQDFNINTVGQINILEYSKNHGSIPVILASSNKEYTDGINSVPLVETPTRYEIDHSCNKYKHGFDEQTDIDGGRDNSTNSPYGVSKIAADKYTREYANAYGIPVIVNRMSAIYGLFQKGVQDQGWVSHFVRTIMKEGKLNIFGDGKQVRDVLDARDVARLYLLQMDFLLEHKLALPTFSNVYNVGGGPKQNLSLLECIRLIEDMTEKYCGTDYHDWRRCDHKYYVSDIRKVCKDFDWKPQIRIKKTLQDMIDEVENEEN